jgi:hypothetical protein
MEGGGYGESFWKCERGWGGGLHVALEDVPKLPLRALFVDNADEIPHGLKFGHGAKV